MQFSYSWFLFSEINLTQSWYTHKKPINDSLKIPSYSAKLIKSICEVESKHRRLVVETIESITTPQWSFVNGNSITGVSATNRLMFKMSDILHWITSDLIRHFVHCCTLECGCGYSGRRLICDSYYFVSIRLACLVRGVLGFTSHEPVTLLQYHRNELSVELSCTTLCR